MTALLAVGNRRDAHRHVEFFKRDMTVRFTERRFRLDIHRVDIALDDDFCFGRNHQIDGLGLHDIDRLAGKPARYLDFIDADGQLLRSHERDIGRTAEHDGAGHFRVAALLVRLIVTIAASTANARGHAHNQTVRRLQRGPVGAHVLDTRVRDRW